MFQATVLNHGQLNSRSLEIAIDNKKIVTPTYFPAISSAATRLQLVPLIDVCVSSGYPRLLVFAYDISNLQKTHQTLAKKMLKRFSEQNFLFLDSGTFESYWLNDRKWSYEKYKKKGDRCSCICHSPKNNMSCCKKCRDELWPVELCAIENFDESQVLRFDNADDAINALHS